MTNVPGHPDHAAPPPPFIQRARKFLVSVLGALAIVAATGTLTGRTEVLANAVLGLATAFGVYVTPNKTVATPRV